MILSKTSHNVLFSLIQYLLTGGSVPTDALQTPHVAQGIRLS